MVKLALLVLGLMLAVAGWAMGRGPVTAGYQYPTTRTAQATVGDQRFEITEDELTRQLNQQLAGQMLGDTPFGAVTLQHITAQLRNGKLQASGDAQVGSASMQVSIGASGFVENERAVITVDDVRVGRLPLPSNIRDDVQVAIQTELDAQVDQLALRVTSLSIGDGKLVVTGTVRR